MINMNMQQFKQYLQMQKKVLPAMLSVSQKALSKIGAYVMRRAATSMRYNKGTSKPGKPPYAHTGLIRDKTYFVVENYAHNVLIGPIKLNKPSKTALKALEHGGETLVMLKAKHSGKLLGMRPIMIQARPFMQPAFDKEKMKSPKLWEDALRG